MHKTNRYINLTDLPRFNNSERIDWKKSVGYKINFIYGDIKDTLLITNCDYKSKKITIKCEGYKDFDIFSGHLKDCKLGEMLNKYTSDFKFKIGDIINNLIIIDKKYEKRKHGKSFVNEKVYKIKCLKCGYECGEHYKKQEYKKEYWIIETDILQNHGCPVCCRNPQIVVKGINDIPTTAPWMIPYFQGGYDEAKLHTCSSSFKINPICPDCGKIQNKFNTLNKIYTNHSIGCSCKDGISYPEKFMFNFLNQLEIDFQTQLSKSIFKWCKSENYDYRYDFYIPSLNCIIETHGGQHYIESSTNTQFKKTLTEEQTNDKLKKELAKRNNINYYVSINCCFSDMNWIKNSIINSELTKLFDLSKIDWSKCDEFALKNIVKLVCETKNELKLTNKQLAIDFKLSTSTISKYLKNGKMHNWC